MWEVTIQHKGLRAYRVVRGYTQEEAELKAGLQLAKWDERWNSLLVKQKKTDLLRSNKETASSLTEEIQEQVTALETLLKSSLQQPPLGWDCLKDKTTFNENPPKKPVASATPIKPSSPAMPPKPDAPVMPLEPVPDAMPPEPDKSHFLEAQNNLGWMYRLGHGVAIIPLLAFRGLRRRKENAAANALESAHTNWRENCASIEAAYQAELIRWSEKCAFIEAAYQSELMRWSEYCASIDANFQTAMLSYSKQLSAWEQDRACHESAIKEQHAHIDQLKKEFAEGDVKAVEFFCSEVLNHSPYPDNLPQDSTVSFNQSNRVLVVDFELPNQSALPKIKEVKYIAVRDQLQEIPMPETWIKRTYDDVLYQVALRTLHELFVADEFNIVKSIVFNGWVRSIDKATGIETHGCILSVQAEREEFLQINLSQVEPKACFRKLKGVASSKLIELAPIRPILTINKEDPRFVDAYAVAETLDDRTNLAAMDWMDFENLIREIFEKEFSKNGGEVKITQASRDGGVDAIAFDPDPIRGGKIIIQAKRYTNVVGVAAVRDLFGTVHNEGANKGILVTTSTYGPDAYEFAKGKPLTLLSGNELLGLLAAHGHKAKIDLQEAKLLSKFSIE